MTLGKHSKREVQVKTGRLTGRTKKDLGVPGQVEDLVARAYAYRLVEIANGTTTEIISQFPSADIRIDINPGNRDMLIKWLRIMKRPSKRFRDAICDALTRIPTTAPNIVPVTRGNQIDIFYADFLEIREVRGAFAFMLSQIIGADYSKHILECPECIYREEPAWFFDKPKGRVIKTYCTTTHADAARQRRNRK